MQWNVEGADPETGDECVIPVEASTADEAEKIARRQGLLVAAVHRASIQSPADALDQMVASGAIPPSTRSRPLIVAPQYEDIASGARMLRFFAFFASVVGFITLFAAVVVGALAAKAADGDVRSPVLVGILAGGSFLGSAFVCFVAAVSLRMYAALALAVRDMARNSFV